MSGHFGRFRILNRSEDQEVAEAELTLKLPPFVYSVPPILGPGTDIPLLPDQFYAEGEYEEGELEGTHADLKVTLSNATFIELTDLTLPAPGPIWSLDLEIFKKSGAHKGRIFVAGWDYSFTRIANLVFAP